MRAAQDRRRVRGGGGGGRFGTYVPTPALHIFKPRRVFSRSHRLKESYSLPDIAEDLKSIQSDLGIAADHRVDFILIRDDLVAREVPFSRRHH